MKQIHKNLFIGDNLDCSNGNADATVHACKSCHQKIIGYFKKLPQDHPDYLVKEFLDDMYINLVDMNRILPRYTDESIKRAIRFIDKKLSENKKVLIHCDEGQSRSCAIAIVYLAKKNVINNNSFSNALNDFEKLYPTVRLGIGFYNYLYENWEDLTRCK